MNSEKKTFDYIWENVVFPAISFCISEVDEELKVQLGFKHENFSKYKKDLGKMFNRKREWLKAKYLPEKGESARLDFHKLSALLCRCIIGNKLFSYNKEAIESLFEERKNDNTIPIEKKLQWEIDYAYINYKLAFWASVGMVYINVVSWAYKRIEQNNDENIKDVYTEFLKCLERENNLLMYKKSEEHDDFCTSMIVALMKNDLLLRDFDYLCYAASMFQWQEFTKRIIFTEILLDPKRNFGFTIDKIKDFM